MAFNAGTIMATLGLNATAFVNQMRTAMRTATSTGNQMSSAFNGSRTQVTATGRAAVVAGTHFKDLGRIVSGIMLAQAFYRTVRALELAGKAVWDFTNNMKTSTIALEYFLGTKERTQQFLEVMKDFAAVTPYTTEEAIGQARTLMAMGFAAESVKSVMEILTDTTSAMGIGNDVLQRITWSLGQIRSTGKLGGREIRELGLAGIPIMQILNEELGLTKDQMNNIGKMQIDGGKAVAAILIGLEKRYKGAADRISLTLQGLWSTIKDDFLIISDKAIAGTYEKMRLFVKAIRDGFEAARDIVDKSGVGGLFESWFGVEMQTTIRTIIAGFRLLVTAIGNVFKAFLPVIQLLGGSLLSAYAKIIPVVAQLINTFAQLITWIIATYPAVRTLIAVILSLVVAQVAAKSLMFLWKVTQLGAICTAVANAVMTLATAIKGLVLIVIKSPIIAILLLLAGVLGYFALKSQAASNVLASLKAQFIEMTTIDIGGILTPTTDSVASTDAFNKRLAEMSGNLTDVGNSAKKAGAKVKKGLQSFDEIFALTQATEDLAGAEADAEDAMPSVFAGGLTDIGLPDLSMPNLKLPDIADFGKIFGGIIEGIKKFFTETLPGWFSGLLGKIGAWFAPIIEKIKAFFAPLVAFFAPIWDSIVKGAKKIFDPFKTWWGIWGADVLGTFSNAWILIKTIAIGIWNDLVRFWEKYGPDITKTFYAAYEGAKFTWEGIVKVIKWAIGLIKSQIDIWWPIICQIFAKTWETIKVITEQVFGFILDAVGSTFRIVNNVIQAVLDVISGNWSGAWDHIKEVLKTGYTFLVATFYRIKTSLDQIWSQMKFTWLAIWDGIWKTLEAPVMVFWAFCVLVFSAIKQFISDTWEGIKTTAVAVWNGFTEIIGVIKTIVTVIFIAIEEFIVAAWNRIKATAIAAWNGIKDTVQSFKTVCVILFLAIENFVKDAWDGIKDAAVTAWKSISDAATGFWDTCTMIFNTLMAIGTALWDSLVTSITTFWNKCILVFKAIETLGKGIWDAMVTAVANIITKIKDKFAAFGTEMKRQWKELPAEFTKMWTTIKDTIATIWAPVAKWFDGLWGQITTGVPLAWAKVKTALSLAWGGITKIFEGLKTTWLGIWNSIGTTIKGIVNGLIRTINTMISSINGIAVTIPSWVPGGLGGQSLGFNIRNIPELETGGVVTGDGIYRLGEKNRKEAVIPLDNSNYMRPFALAVARELAIMNSTNNGSQRDIMYVGTLVADDQGIKELARKMDVVRLKEIRRAG